MQIRQLTANEMEERIALSEFAFQKGLSEEEAKEYKASFRPEEHWGAFGEDGKLMSGLHLIPFEMRAGRTLLKMGGIASVATWPEARRYGCVTKLLGQALVTMREQGQTVSMLHPFSFPFYRKFGWEMTVERKMYVIAQSQLPKRSEVSGKIVRAAKEADAFNDLYDRFAMGRVGMLKRSPEWWRSKVFSKPGLAAIWKNESSEPEGYILYEVSGGTFAVHEWVALTEEARRGLWQFAANHDSMADKVTMTVPADDESPFLFADPRFKQEVVPYFMSRIVDAEGFVSLLPFAPGAGNESLRLALRDEFAPWNDGVFRIEWDAEGAARMRREEEAAVRSDGVACDIQTLTAMLLGNRRPADLERWGRLRGDAERIELLERRVPAHRPYLADFF